MKIKDFRNGSLVEYTNHYNEIVLYIVLEILFDGTQMRVYDITKGEYDYYCESECDKLLVY